MPTTTAYGRGLLSKLRVAEECVGRMYREAAWWQGGRFRALERAGYSGRILNGLCPEIVSVEL